MKKVFHNWLITSVIAVLLLQPYFILFLSSAKAADSTVDYITDVDQPAENPDPGGNGKIIPPDDPIFLTADDLMGYTPDSSGTLSKFNNNNPLINISDLTSTPKLTFSPADLQDLRTLYCLGNVIPDFANHDDSLAVASGKSISDIDKMKSSNPTGYQDLIAIAQETARKNLVSNLKNDLPNFACIAGVDQDQAATMLKYDSTAVDKIIDIAQNKIVIDRRVLELLMNLVTPKDKGGAGHELIKVLRIRNGYNRDARQYSQESNAIYQQNAEAENSSKSSLNTVGDLSAADSNTLENDPLVADSRGQAEVIDSAGTNQGDLIFSDTEDAKNLSAHYKGEAVDISAVDNIKCTLIKKKRLGSDDKTKLPATPINLTWQTSTGYDNSPPPDYSSLDANLRQLASGNYSDLLDQLGISVDSTTDLSHATFSDIVSLVGKSLIGEMLNSPNMALSGTTFADTIKKIGAMVFADTLNLPRQAFVTANLADVNDLEAKIGEAELEKKLNLPWGSLQGKNLNDILVNVGQRHVESALNLPENTLTTKIADQNGLKLAIGRRTIENALSLPANSFSTDTNYGKLKEIAGARKIDLTFQNPASVDERLGLGINNYSAQYKSGALSADNYAILVANKVLSDNVYSFASATASANAARLSVDTTTNSNITANSNTRMTDILAGNNLSANFQQIGMETLAGAFSNQSDVRAALVVWLQSNLSDTTCVVPSLASANITLSDGSSKTITLPEDQFMTNFGLQRGDFFQLFGCSNVNPLPVLKSIGQKALYDSIANSTAVKQAESSYLAQHPEITSVLQEVDFYKTRIDTIKTTTNKIKSDWSGINSDDSQLSELESDIASVADALKAIDTGNLLSGIDVVKKIRDLAITFNRAFGVASGANTDDQNLRTKINATLVDFSVISQNVEEILTGQPQSQISSLQLSALGNIGLGNTNSSDNGTKISAASLALMLSGKLSPESFLISIGGNKIETALDLPTNSIYYYANFSRNKSDQAKISGKDAFFQAIGQAQLEETLHLPPNFFQSDESGAAATLNEVSDHVSKVWGISSAEAGAQIMKALNLPGDFSSIASTQAFSTGSSVALAANNLDSQLSIPTGTTLKFFSGGSVVSDTLSSSDAELVAGRLNLPQNLVSTFTRVKTGGQNLSDALKQSFTSLITYNSHNGFAPQIANSTNTGSCPIAFSYSKQNGINYSISNQIQDNGYVYADADGTHTLSSMTQAQNYATANQDKQIDFLKGLAEGLASDPTKPDNFDTASIAHYQDALDNFLADPTKAEAFSADELSGISNKFNIPTDTLKDLFNRKSQLDNLSQKPIGPYLQLIGKRTAENRIMSAMFGSLGISVAGIKIDAGDIFDLLSGNSLSVAEKIGAKYLEGQLGIKANQIISVVQSGSSIIRNCSLANLGANFVGGALGLGTVSLSGNIYDNVGAAKIEKILNLPADSFRGATLDELISSVGPVSFARAFELPPDQVLSNDVISNLALSSTTSTQSILDQYRVTEDRVNFPDSTSATISLSSTTSRLEQNISSALTSSFTTTAPAQIQSVNDFQTANFLSQTSAIDSQLGIPAGTTKQLLTRQISPDDFRHKVADSVIGFTTGGIATWGNLLGLSPKDLGIANLASQFLACKNNKCDYGGLFNEFSQVFGINLDNKLHLPAGSISRIITNPEQAPATLLYSALSRLDNSLGLDPASDASLTAAYTGLNLPYSDVWRSGQLQFRTDDRIHAGGTISQDRWEYYGDKISGQLIKNYFMDKYGGSIPSFATTAALATTTFVQLSHGDLRGLEVIAAMKTAESLNLVNNSTTPNLPAYFRITYEDIVNSINGDASMEQSYVDIARANYLTQFSNKKTTQTPAADTAVISGSATTPLYGSQCPPGVTPGSTGDCNSGDPTNPGAVYNPVSNMGTMTANWGTANPNDPTVDPTAAVQELQKSAVAMESLNRVEESARSQADQDLRNNLLWRMADAKLYSLDQNIPAGFTKTMYSGNGAQRTAILHDFIENSLKNLSWNGISYNKVELGIDLYNKLMDFYHNPSAFNLNSLTAAQLTTIDNWLGGKLNGILGFQLQPGTFAALINGYKTGNWSEDFSLSGVKMTSLSGLYSDWLTAKITGWADHALGLPPGTVYAISSYYSAYRNLSSAKNALSLALNNPRDAAGMAEAEANYKSAEATANMAIAVAVNLVFSKQIGQFESAFGLVQGTGSMLVTMLITGFNPISVGLFVLQNLFGVYKTVVTCTADGYYPGIESPPDSSVVDNGNLGTFDGLNNNAKKAGYIAAAQYKNKTLIGDALMLSERTGDPLAIPSQIMTGRQDDVDWWQYKVNNVICDRIGGCADTLAGLWQNPQATSDLHIGF